ncbi:hypothetical protein EZS27_031381 [termite gut metagenome]|uniref:DUF4492 domain-containing protein n=1 Tax=termite gut metagenome TaxID=433724 RepID=A0A5J4QCF5_9ZZZZ
MRVFRFYLEGFKGMTWGKTLWLIILVKLFILFFILKLFFFPNYLKKFGNESEKEQYVSEELIQRAIKP